VPDADPPPARSLSGFFSCAAAWATNAARTTPAAADSHLFAMTFPFAAKLLAARAIRGAAGGYSAAQRLRL
jgi:hypothetical protein